MAHSRTLSFRRWLALSIAGFVAFFAIWWLIAASGLVQRQFLPTPLEVLERFVALTHTPFVGYTLQQHLASSFGRFAAGFGLAVLIGVPLGLLMGWFRWLDAVVSPLFDALRFVAPIAWVPFAALWFGTGIGGPVLIIFSGAFPPCVINAYRGAKYVEPRFFAGGQMRGGGPWVKGNKHPEALSRPRITFPGGKGCGPVFGGVSAASLSRWKRRG